MHDVFHLPVEHYLLSNGLRVHLLPDKRVPVVAVNIWYHVGSKDERAHQTGLAHLFEHLMFEGSANCDGEYFRPLQEAGGTVNGSTSNDRTNYYEVVPSSFLERALWMEADRMGHLLPVLDHAKFENQRSVVKNERRQRVDNQPYGQLGEKLSTLLYPANHPYSWPVIGWMEHLDQLTLQDAHQFFQTFYQPSNASLAVVGQFHPQQARDWIDQYFGPLSSTPTSPSQFPTSSNGNSNIPEFARPGHQREILDDDVSLPRLDLVWPTSPRFNDDEPALDLAAEILAGRSKDSRLSRKLIRDDRTLTSIGASHLTMKWDGRFSIRALGIDANTPMEKIEKIIRQEVDTLAHNPPTTQELERARRGLLNSAFSRVETALGRADTINSLYFYQEDMDPEGLQKELNQYLQVDADQVSNTLRRYVAQGRGSVALITRPLSNGTAKAKTSGQDDAAARNHEKNMADSTPNVPGPQGDFPFGLPQVQHAKLSNGMQIRVVQQNHLPRVHLMLITHLGSRFDAQGQVGLADLTAHLMDEGTTQRDGLELARKLDELGSTLGISSGVDAGYLSMRSLTTQLHPSFELLAEVARCPRFDADDIAREKQRLLAALHYRQRQPSAQANDAIDELLFGPHHPYGRPAGGRIDDLADLQAHHLQACYQRYNQPEKMTLLAVGDTDANQIRKLAEQYFADWKTPAGLDLPTDDFPLVDNIPKTRWISRPESTQTTLRVGTLAVDRQTPDYFPLLVLNTILGGQFTSRLNLILREEKGYTYGARTSLTMRQHAGSWIAGADVQASTSGDALETMLTQLRQISATQPVTLAECQASKAYLTRRFPARFETMASVLSHLAQISIFNLPDDFYNNYIPSVEAVTVDDLNRVAQQYLADAPFSIVAVGHDHALQQMKEAVQEK